MIERRVDAVVIGAGPAGIAAAVEAAERGRAVVVLDEAPAAGGPLWRGKLPARGRALMDRAERAGVEISPSAAVFDIRPGEVLAERDGEALRWRCRSIVLATGSIERFLPFPGWTLPGVFGVGGLQAMIKGGLDVRGKRVVVAGTGPLMFATAALAREGGADVVEIVEQAAFGRVVAFGAAMALASGKARQTLSLLRALRGIPRSTSSHVSEAHGDGVLEEVEVRGRRGDRVIPCDVLACGYGLVPRLEAAALLGCAIEARAVVVDERQRTSVEGVLAAGEITGIAGVDAALIEGRIAGLTVAGEAEAVRRLARRRRRARNVGSRIERAFFLGPWLQELPRRDTITCRCEDVCWGDLAGFTEARDAKLQTRCGMGPCQGRVCGPALDQLAGLGRDRPRQPLAPVTLSILASAGRRETTDE